MTHYDPNNVPLGHGNRVQDFMNRSASNYIDAIMSNPRLEQARCPQCKVSLYSAIGQVTHWSWCRYELERARLMRGMTHEELMSRWYGAENRYALNAVGDPGCKVTLEEKR